MPKNEVVKLGGNKKQKPAVEEYGVQEYVLKLHGEKIPTAHISTRLKVEKDIEISAKSIGKWLTEFKQKEVDKKSVALSDKYELLVINYEEEIKGILSEVKEMKDLAKEQKQLDIYVKLIGKLYQGLELLAKLMGDIKPSGTVDINIIINEINKRSFGKHKDARDKLFRDNVIDIETTIVEEDKKREEELKK